VLRRGKREEKNKIKQGSKTLFKTKTPTHPCSKEVLCMGKDICTKPLTHLTPTPRKQEKTCFKNSLVQRQEFAGEQQTFSSHLQFLD